MAKKNKIKSTIKADKEQYEEIEVDGLSENKKLIDHLREAALEMVSTRGYLGVDAELMYCQEVIDDNLTCVDQDALEFEKTIDQAIDGITATKRDDAISIHTDLVIGQLNKLFKISPTPIPDLPKREEDEVINVIEQLINQQVFDRIDEAVLGYMERLTQEGIPVTKQEATNAVLNSDVNVVPDEDEIFEIAKKFKGRALAYVQKQAIKGAKKMERSIHDILVETGYGAELLKFIEDFNSYPYAVMRTGSHIPISRKVWKGNKWTIEDQVLPVAVRVAPHNFYWSADSLGIDDGEAVGDVLYLKRSDLQRMYAFEESKVIKQTIAECVTKCNAFESWRNWLEYLGHTEENKDKECSTWNSGVTVPCFRIHITLDKCMLEKLGVDVVNDLYQFECEAWLLNDKIIRFKLYDPKGYRRPYVLEKFRHLSGKFSGKSLCKILKPIEHQIRSTERNKVLNIGFSSAPITLRDETAFNTDEDSLPEVISPGENLTVRSYPGKTMKPVEYVIVPNITAQLRAELADLYAKADLKSKIPRLLTGQGQLGSGVRSASMLATQIAGASKNLKNQIWLIGANVVIPHVENVFDFLMRTSKDNDMKVDAAVQIGSIESIVNREFLVDHIKGLLQFLAPYVAGGQVPGDVIQQLLFTLMSETGISEESNNAQILDEFEGIVNDVSGSVGLNQTSGGPQLDARSNFQPVDTGGL